MKTPLRSFVFAIVLATIVFSQENDEFSHGVTPRDFVTDIINSTLNGIVQNLSDPMTISSFNISLPSTSILSGSANLSNLKVYGINSVYAPNISLDIINMALNMTVKIPNINASFKYGADMVLGELVPLYGNGSLQFTFDEIELSIIGKANLSGGTSVSNLTLGLTLGNADFRLGGLLNNEEFSILVSTLLNDNAVNFLQKYQTFVSNTISSIVQTVINSILNGTSTTGDDVYNLIKTDETIKQYVQLP